LSRGSLTAFTDGKLVYITSPSSQQEIINVAELIKSDER